MSSQQAPQIRLSDSCQTFIDQWQEVVRDNSKEEEFWDSAVQFHKDIDLYPEDAKAKIGIKENIAKIVDYFDKISVLRAERENARRSGLKDDVLERSETIRSDFRELIEEVKQLQKKTSFVEDLKLLDIGTGWASSLLTRYYQVISNAGSLEDIVTTLDSLLSLSKGRKEDEKTIRSNLVRQKSKVDLIGPVIENLKKMNRGFPTDLRERLSCIETSLGEFKGLYEEKMDVTEKAGKLLGLHKKLKEELQNLYEETIKKSVMG
jgi:hypothetical protein